MLSDYDDIVYDGTDLSGGYTGSEPLLTFQEVQKFIQKTLLRDTYINVKTPEESKWVQELLFSVGIYWIGSGNRLIEDDEYYVDCWFGIDSHHRIYLYRLNSHSAKYQIDIPYLETLFDTKFEAKSENRNCVTFYGGVEELQKDNERLQSLVNATSEKLYERDQQIKKLNEELLRQAETIETYQKDIKKKDDELNRLNSIKQNIKNYLDL